ncbi:MAG: hypothetical protein M5U08_24570 [Burkholderiales bacterium]|nr:hypothetical protein [Burkholderiales bacterium]
MRPAATISPGSAPCAVTVPADGRDELRVAQPVLRERDLRLCGLHLRLGAAEVGLGLLERRAGDRVLRNQVLEAFVLVAGLDQPGPRPHELRPRRLQRALLVLGVEAGDREPRLHFLADVDQPLDQPPVDAEREVHLGLRLDAPGEGDRLSGGALVDCQDAHRPDLGRRGRFGARARREQRGGGQRDERDDAARERTDDGGGGERHGPSG